MFNQNLWPALKVIWGVVITIVTVALAYGQFAVGTRTLRPVLDLQLEVPTKDLLEQHGVYAHLYRITNTGTVVAKEAKITVITRQPGHEAHVDHDKPLGDYGPKHSDTYAIHPHSVLEDSPGDPKYELVEEVILRYTGHSIFRFWCTPTYTYRAFFVRTPKNTRWTYHSEKAPVEDEECL